MTRPGGLPSIHQVAMPVHLHRLRMGVMRPIAERSGTQLATACDRCSSVATANSVIFGTLHRVYRIQQTRLGSNPQILLGGDMSAGGVANGRPIARNGRAPLGDGAHGATKKERHACVRRRAGEAAGSSQDGAVRHDTRETDEGDQMCSDKLWGLHPPPAAGALRGKGSRPRTVCQFLYM